MTADITISHAGLEGLRDFLVVVKVNWEAKFEVIIFSDTGGKGTSGQSIQRPNGLD